MKQGMNNTEWIITLILFVLGLWLIVEGAGKLTAAGIFLLLWANNWVEGSKISRTDEEESEEG